MPEKQTKLNNSNSTTSNFNLKGLEEGDRVTIGSDALLTGDSTITINDGTTIGGYVQNTGTSIGTTSLYDSNQYGYINFLQSVKLTNNITLAERKSNILIVPNNNMVISWDEDNCLWVCSRLHEFKHELKIDNNKKSEKPYNFSNSVHNKLEALLSFFISSEGNIYVDLENDSYYQYSSSDCKWNPLNGSISSLKFLRNFNVKSILKKRAERTLLCEKMKTISFITLGSGLDAGFVYAPYIPIDTTITISDPSTIINFDSTTTSSVASRYSTYQTNQAITYTDTTGIIAF